jgi:hypothetical protein
MEGSRSGQPNEFENCVKTSVNLLFEGKLFIINDGEMGMTNP